MRSDKFGKRNSWLGLLLAAFVSCAGAQAVLAEGGAQDRGGTPWTVDVEKLTTQNKNFREAHWTGGHLQMTVMSLKPGEEIGLEMHGELEQFIRIEQGQGRVVMGKEKDRLDFDQTVSDDWAIFVPAGYWHNVINTGRKDLKLYTLYAPPEHPAGTVHKTAAESQADPHHHH